MGGGTGTGHSEDYPSSFVIPEDTERLSRKKARQIVNQLFIINRKRRELANENKPKLQERVGNSGTLSRNGLDFFGYITNKKITQGINGEREGYFLIAEKTGDAYQIPKKRVVIEDGKIEGVFIDMGNINRDINPAEGRFYGKIKLEEKLEI